MWLTRRAIFGRINMSSSLCPIERSSSQINGCFGMDDTVPLSLNLTSLWDSNSLWIEEQIYCCRYN